MSFKSSRRTGVLLSLAMLRVAVAKVVAFVHKHDIGIVYLAAIEFVTSQHLLGDDMGGNACAEQFVAPHLLQGGWTDDQGLVALVIGVILKQFLADPGFAKAHAIGNHDAIVTRQDFARLLHGILLE